MTKVNAVVDIQGFRGIRNKFVVKELAVSYNIREFQNFLIKPPYAFEDLPHKQQNQAKWLFNNHHGLTWNEGSINFESVRLFLQANLKDTTIYVKGSEKKSWLYDVLGENYTIYDLDDFGASNLQKLREKYPYVFKCPTHSGFCALQNVLVLRNFVDEMLLKENFVLEL